MPNKIIGRAVGALFLLGFVVYIAGNILIGSALGTTDPAAGAADHPGQVRAGALLMLTSSAFVAAVGVLMLPILRPRHATSAHAYLVEGAITAVTLAVGTLSLLALVPIGQQVAATGETEGAVLTSLARVAQDGHHNAYLVAMTSHALGGLVLCRDLLHARLVPRSLAVLGLVGYAVHAGGTVLELLGQSAFGIGLSDLSAAPGGLFEVTFGVLLLIKGFPTAADGGRVAAGPLTTTVPALTA